MYFLYSISINVVLGANIFQFFSSVFDILLYNELELSIAGYFLSELFIKNNQFIQFWRKNVDNCPFVQFCGGSWFVQMIITITFKVKIPYPCQVSGWDMTKVKRKESVKIFPPVSIYLFFHKVCICPSGPIQCLFTEHQWTQIPWVEENTHAYFNKLLFLSKFACEFLVKKVILSGASPPELKRETGRLVWIKMVNPKS